MERLRTGTYVGTRGCNRGGRGSLRLSSKGSFWGPNVPVKEKPYVIARRTARREGAS